MKGPKSGLGDPRPLEGVYKYFKLSYSKSYTQPKSLSFVLKMYQHFNYKSFVARNLGFPRTSDQKCVDGGRCKIKLVTDFQCFSQKNRWV